MLKDKCFPEAYSEPSRTSMMELFCENRKQVIAVCCFRKKIIHHRYATGPFFLSSSKSISIVFQRGERKRFNFVYRKNFFLYKLLHNQEWIKEPFKI